MVVGTLILSGRGETTLGARRTSPTCCGATSSSPRCSAPSASASAGWCATRSSRSSACSSSPSRSSRRCWQWRRRRALRPDGRRAQRHPGSQPLRGGQLLEPGIALLVMLGWVGIGFAATAVILRRRDLVSSVPGPGAARYVRRPGRLQSWSMAPPPRSRRRPVFPPKQCSVESRLGPFIGSSDLRRRHDRSPGDRARGRTRRQLGASNDIPVDFGWSPTAPTPGQVVTFTAAASPPSGVAIKSYDWDLNGDGSIDKHGATATWSYPAPGPVSVRLRVKGNKNHRRRCCPHGVGPGRGAAVVRPDSTVASFTIAPAAPVANQPVLFTSTSSDPDGTLIEQVWDLNGDGNYDNGGGATALRSFADAGELRGRAPGDGRCRARLLRLADADGRTCAGDPSRHDAEVGTAAAEPVPGRADRGPDHRARDPRTAPTREGTRAGRRSRSAAPAAAAPSRSRCGRSRRAPARARRSASAFGVSSGCCSPGVRVRVYVTKRGAVGKYTRFRFRAGNAPVRTDRCVMPGSWAPAECPAL